MKSNLLKKSSGLAIVSLLLTLALQPARVLAQGTAFTYQGRLVVNGNPSINGFYDFQFKVFDSPTTGGTSYGSSSINDVTVSNGLFTVTMDFGAGVFTGPARYLQISVCTNNAGTPVLLTPRQPLTPSPYSIYAANSSNATQLGGNNPSSYAPATGSSAYVSKTGDTMTGTLNLPANGLAVGGSQLVVSGGKVGIGTAPSTAQLGVATSSSNAVAITGSNSYSGVYGQFAVSETIGGGDFPEDAYIGVYGNNGFTTPSYYFGDYAGYFDGSLYVNGASYLQGTVTVNGTAGVSGNTSGSEFGVVNSFSGTPTTSCMAVTGTAESGIGINGSGYIGVLGSTANIAYGRGVLGSAYGGANSWGGLFTYGSTGNNAAYLGGNGAAAIFYGPVTVEGTTTVQVLTITGGSDVAEPFDLSTKDVPKGSVVIIDDTTPGQLKLSNRPYDTRVAGIVSGANGINPGLSLHQQGKLESGDNIALSGRVYVLADASFGAIKPGDLLTTSGTPGHCMKVTDHRRAQGAVIGKAMSSLKNGKGTVLVLVTLQ